MADSHEVANLRAELEALKSVPAAEARTMPPAYYTSESFLNLEREEIFRKEWICLGHVAEISKPGDYFTTEIVGEQLLVTHGADGKIRVLSNVCRHRANVVAKDKGNRKRFVCSYHAWTYADDGALTAAPLMTESRAFNKEKCGLPQFATEVWQDFIYVNLDGNALPLAPRLEAFLPNINNYHHVGRHHQFVTEDVWKTNWKCLVENFMEGYHLSVAHLKTLHPMTPTSTSKKMPAPEGMTAYTSGYSPNWPERGPFHEDLTAAERRYSVLFSVFPNCMVSIVPNVTLYLLVRPIDADTVGVKWGIAGNIADPNHSDVIRYRDLCFAFNAEDKEQLEGVQKGMKTRYLQSGPLAPADFEGAVWDFYQYMASKLGRDGDGRRSANKVAAE
ncbi:MAG: aromatic ring-hydroxylating dioxygenase subunit alpha [Pseudomonadota bacterium]|nr:aromatic ring-hydroxylating dioxygenase subunit alpha [Pseudomonadota bacterium]